MLEKLNSIVHDCETQKVIKQIVGRKEAQSELLTLKTLQSFKGLSGHSARFAVPDVFEAESSHYSVSMARVSGIRVYELVAILNNLINHSPRNEIVQKAFALKTALLEWAIADLKYFQSAGIQQALTSSLSPILSVYNFQEKFSEALNYLSELTGLEINSKLWAEVEHISGFLAEKANVTFRDATLKNRILKIPELDKIGEDSRGPTMVGDYYRPTNVQWTDAAPVSILLDSVTDPEQLKSQVSNVDFESAHTVTTCQDDYIHILTLEITGWTYDTAYPFWSGELKITEEEYNISLLFRCFREWIRRLFYKCERRRIYNTRYIHETLGHNFHLAFDAVQRLRGNAQEDYLPELHALMSNFEREQRLSGWL